MNEIDWRNGKPIDPGVVRRFEERFGVTLPRGYVEVVLAHDGATPSLPTMPYRDEDGGEGLTDVGLIRFVQDNPKGVDMNRCAEGLRRTHPQLVPFADDGGGAEACFDYSGGDQPAVVFLDPDASTPRPVAGSWEGFLALLRPFVGLDDETAP